MAKGQSDEAGRVAVLMPSAADADNVTHILQGAGIAAERVSLAELVAGIRSAALGAAVLSAEASQSHARDLKEALADEPRWSFFPFILLVERGVSQESGGGMADLGNVRILEQPVDKTFLIEAVKSSLFVRRQQRRAGAYLAERDEAAEKLQQLTADLEGRVRARTNDLRVANERLLKEIEERRVTEEKLRESEELYRHTLKVSRHIAWTADAEGEFLYFSPHFTEVTGLPALTPPEVAIHPEDIDRVMETWRSSVAAGRPHLAEFRMRVRDGSYRLFRSRAAPRTDEQGAIICWYGATEDIQEQRDAELARLAAEERLRESEALYRYTVELSQQLVWTATPDGRIISISPRFTEITGLNKTLDPHEGWLEVVHPDDHESILKIWRDTVEHGTMNVAEFRMRVKDGSYRTFLARAAPRRDASGKIVRWYGYTVDIEDQKQAEAGRQAAEELYRFAARATNDAIWDMDLASDSIHWSDSAAETLGYPGQKLGTTDFAWWEERVHPEDRAEATASLERALGPRKARWSATYRFRRGNGEYGVYFDRSFIIRDEAGTAVRVIGAMTDLTERHKADEAIRRMQAELIHVSRLSAMGTMASTLAHELNQPLTAVANFVRGSRRLLETGGEDRLAEARQALASAEAGALRAGQIVKRLRELVARGTSALRPEQLSKLIEDAGTLAFIDAKLLGVTHTVDVEPDAEWVEVDKIQVQQVLINLVRNGVQAMRNVERREISIAASAISQEMVQVSVSDTGPGIAPEVRDALFSPFHGTKEDGLGIGLSICRTIVEAHGGKIWAADRDEGGTMFCFTLPRYDEPRA